VAVFTAMQIARAAGGRVARGREGMEASGVSTDSRTLAPGELFIPLVGPNFDGHDFAERAVAAGAAGVLVQRGRALPRAGEVFVIEVEDTLRALGDLARFHRERHEVSVVVVTGSNGKTTTKEMIASILAQGAETLKSEGNLNNLVGLPHQVLRLLPEHTRAVFEMGMNQPGEIRRLAWIALPQIGVITNVAPAHLEGLGSIEAVREAKGELLEGMGARGRAALSADDPHSRLLAERFRQAGGEVLTFGLAEDSKVRGEAIRVSAREGTRFLLHIGGRRVATTRRTPSRQRRRPPSPDAPSRRSSGGWSGPSSSRCASRCARSPAGRGASSSTTPITRTRLPSSRRWRRPSTCAERAACSPCWGT